MSNQQWQLSGSMPERYEEFLVPVIFTPWAQELLSRAALSEGAELLDLACGTGIVARMAATRGVRVCGADLNPGMLAQAETQSAGQNITCRQADAAGLPFDAGRFDAVICQQGLQFFPDKPGAVAECFRVLRPGGKAVFCMARGLEENPLMRAQVKAFAVHLDADEANAIRAVCGFADPEETGALFTDAGFDPVSVQAVTLELNARDAGAFVNGLMAATPASERIAALSPEARAALHSDILAGFGSCHHGKALRFPHVSNVVVAAKPA